MLTADDFPLSELTEVVDKAKSSLQGTKGLGFLLVRGIPLDAWTTNQTEIFFWGFGLHLGVVRVAQTARRDGCCLTLVFLP